MSKKLQKRNFKNLKKMRRAGTLNMFRLLLGLKGYFDQNMLFLSQISLSLCKRLISLQIYKAQKFQTTCFVGLGQTKIWNLSQILNMTQFLYFAKCHVWQDRGGQNYQIWAEEAGRAESKRGSRLNLNGFSVKIFFSHEILGILEFFICICNITCKPIGKFAEKFKFRQTCPNHLPPPKKNLKFQSNF